MQRRPLQHVVLLAKRNTPLVAHQRKEYFSSRTLEIQSNTNLPCFKQEPEGDQWEKQTPGELHPASRLRGCLLYAEQLLKIRRNYKQEIVSILSVYKGQTSHNGHHNSCINASLSKSLSDWEGFEPSATKKLPRRSRSIP